MNFQGVNQEKQYMFCHFTKESLMEMSDVFMIQSHYWLGKSMFNAIKTAAVAQLVRVFALQMEG